MKRSLIRELGYDAFKRFFDICVSLGLLIFAVPVMIFLSILVRLNSPGPAIYCQQRLTTNRRIFTMFKFRTMIETAEQNTGATWAAENDPRVTRLGRFMRKTRLDELPQLINVLIGDMSLIGPRPERPEFARLLQQKYPHFKERYQVPAGLSGLAQVESGYADSVESYGEKLKHDLEYVQNRSIILDIKIAIRTIHTIISGFGAR
jgi:lipopolysaccharide/colanic/teichoic acid biosynthesis glycosyltransferase